MHVSTLVRWGAVLTVGIAVAACSDSPSGPTAPSARPKLSAAQLTDAWLLSNGGPSRAGRGRENKEDKVYQADFVVDPTQATTIRVGDHTVSFPANSICDPATSGYGEELWDAPCEALSTPITIHATWTSKAGHALVDFQPALRFVPTSDPAQFVRITMKDYWDLDPSYSYPIFWQRPSDGLWVDESQKDPSMGSVTDLPGKKVSRRLKHFSGYWLGASEVCDAWVSDSCMPLLEFTGWLIGG